ncbi:hypothetical protein DYB25_006837 [Aphanomyces astaci]|uniref:HECT-type E3 ubiquitin transferase n=2 Tax=Aphanomyces astaci TaxID=112090 RepID=A0A397B728_APHAT|nr:hypothetical protein DYB25_006837 [Aphanomyces astaci]RHY55579.1 hypothetical protein DYB38_003965 [Aphanomyces astaci]RHZ40978.1 hypothetical protein DYB26_009602 [Aphanomyces astaci]
MGEAMLGVPLSLDDVEHLDPVVYKEVRYLLFDGVKTQLQAVLLGLHEIVPPELLLVFDHKEFGLLLCGLTDIDMDDWKTSTVTSSNLKGHDVLEDVVESLTRPDQAKLLQFATGSSQDPIQGFKGLTSYDGKIFYFTLKGTEYTPGRYPVIHACYNRIDLPLYPTMGADDGVDVRPDGIHHGIGVDISYLQC